ncbi:glycoprotein-N-acetylgalactosamine 3-beta-galactosyltransferase [Paragonimus westermani]|uniref:N-acetylgalactosaminide beta-1,3-galactosyltransferase n=1 Tax=Paragonimus westermani TaxID=34504 RepID=A0A5J4NC55_9TREM|nr:glycoprotein-N-acetylgalactosamine 3-beta-galactosyltransferase [Paragonimus westermani]
MRNGKSHRDICDEEYQTTFSVHSNLLICRLVICNLYLPPFPITVLNLSVAETRNHLWSKMRATLRHIYQYADQYDFFLKTDDDTYIVIENLLAVLQSYSPEDRFMLGHRFPSKTQGGYLSGGAGYVLSRATLKRLVEEAIDKNQYCPRFDEDKEDVKISICGQAVGVQVHTSFDEHGIDRFNWQSPEQILGIGFWNTPAWSPPKAAFDFTPVVRAQV